MFSEKLVPFHDYCNILFASVHQNFHYNDLLGSFDQLMCQNKLLLNLSVIYLFCVSVQIQHTVLPYVHERLYSVF